MYALGPIQFPRGASSSMDRVEMPRIGFLDQRSTLSPILRMPTRSTFQAPHRSKAAHIRRSGYTASGLFFGPRQGCA